MTRGGFIGLVALAAIVVGGSAAGQEDLGKALVGKWEGKVTTRGVRPGAPRDAGRTLVITAVRQVDQKWVAEARYGITGKGSGSVEITVSVVGGEVILDFITPGEGGGSRVGMKLQKQNLLRGTFRPKGSVQDYEIELERAPGQ